MASTFVKAIVKWITSGLVGGPFPLASLPALPNGTCSFLRNAHRAFGLQQSSQAAVCTDAIWADR